MRKVKRFRLLALSMPMFVMFVFLLIMAGSEQEVFQLEKLCEGSLKTAHIPEWGTIRNEVEMKELTINMFGKENNFNVDFNKEMVVYLITGNTEESMTCFRMKRIEKKAGFFIICCKKGSCSGKCRPFFQLARTRKLEGEGIFSFNSRSAADNP